ncbi:hypothetical protein C7C46_02200 [Streptomyces tateyamensis]|uniref:Uncharacterized protein n=1 Tax=Streptomyces tateyamensis TaxID=565073 RepID=A0A2V4PS72_9ACTN|nr:hypothetical protein [Streptomyces tateyamensis]PYC87873.1 hypothetical protein C7C46_02200 [Streptomyces tateyamensis]
MQRTGISVKQQVALVLAAGTAVVAAGVGLLSSAGTVSADGSTGAAPTASASPNGGPNDWS